MFAMSLQVGFAPRIQALALRTSSGPIVTAGVFNLRFGMCCRPTIGSSELRVQTSSALSLEPLLIPSLNSISWCCSSLRHWHCCRRPGMVRPHSDPQILYKSFIVVVAVGPHSASSAQIFEAQSLRRT